MKLKVKTLISEYLRCDESTALGRLFNEAFKHSSISLVQCQPYLFPRKNTFSETQVRSKRFYKLYLSEMYIHSIINSLTFWQLEANKYCKKYKCKWERYASENRIETIAVYCGEPEDYETDGSIKIKTDKRTLKPYSIVLRMIDSECFDIFIETRPSDMIFFCETLDRTMSEDFIKLMYSVFIEVHFLVKEVIALDPCKDNREFFMSLPGRIQTILDCNLSPVKEYKEVLYGTLSR